MPTSQNNIVKIWLEQLPQLIGGTLSAVIVETPTEPDSKERLYIWPTDSTATDEMLKAAARSAASKHSLIKPAQGQDKPTLIAVPLLSAERLLGSVVILLKQHPEANHKVAMQALQWGKQWLELLLVSESQASSRAPAWIEQILAKANSPDNIANLFIQYFNCDRNMLAVGNHLSLEIIATTPKIEIKRETGLIRSFKEAMFEAIDQASILHYPPLPDRQEHILHCHKSLAQQVGETTILTTPLMVRGETYGAMLLERHRDEPFSAEDRERCRQIAGLTGVLLQQWQQAKKPLYQLLHERLYERLKRWLGSQTVWLKASLILAVVTTALLGIIDGDHQIDAQASLEGSIQRIVAAPFEGYLQQANVTAGDIVKQGDLLCTMDERDLLLEQIKWKSELAKLQKEQREAMASHERAKVPILQAQREQAQAELALVEKQFKRSQIVAPLSGIVVSGDLSQHLGAPLKRGEILFKIAPLDSYRVMLQVDELDIASLQLGQQGHLILTGYPNIKHTFQVKRILPLSTAIEGRNLFTLEAELTNTGAELRPGMQGIARIYAGERRLLWLASHSLIDWFRLRLWGWFG